MTGVPPFWTPYCQLNPIAVSVLAASVSTMFLGGSGLVYI